ncbi:hypothetical protein ACWGOQ_0006550 [Aquimarina sp. M1]
MKNFFIILTLSLFINSCKNDSKKSSDIESTLIRGEYILIDNAGVLKGKDFIYGVVVDDMAQELAKKIKPLQREEYDMVPVVVNGVVKPNTEEGWPEIVEIKEIVGVSKPTSELPTKIKSSDTEQQSSESGHEGHNH